MHIKLVNEKGVPKIGVVTTFSYEMIKVNGGPWKFMRAFLDCMASDTNYWLHRSRNQPQHEIVWVYIIIGNRLRYRVNYLGYETGKGTIYRQGIGHAIIWPRMVLAGPIVKAPRPDLRITGFQGFRYVTQCPFQQ